MVDSLSCWFRRAANEGVPWDRGDIVDFKSTPAGLVAIVVVASDGLVLAVPFGASTLVCKDPTVEANAGEAAPPKAKGHR